MSEAQKSKIIKWIEDAEEIEVPLKAPARIPYDEKLVAYIDVLGISAMILESGNDAKEIFTIMGRIQKYIENECRELEANNKLNYLQLHDAFIIVADLECIGQICKILSTVQWQVLVYSQMLLRGALTAGKVSMSDDSKLIIGKAFIDAFNIEKKNAIFPRIIYANEIDDYVSDKSIDFNNIVEDNDKLRYLDFIGYIYKEQKFNQRKLDNLLTTQGVKAKLKTAYKECLFKERTIAQKYGWIISKLDLYDIKIL